MIKSRQFYFETVQFLFKKLVSLSGGLEFIMKSENAGLVILQPQAGGIIELLSQKSKFRFVR